MRFADGMRRNQFWGQHIVLAHGRWWCSSQVKDECGAFELEFKRCGYSISEPLMTASSQLTYIAVLLAVFAEQLYLPIPSGVFLMAAGALSAHGEMHTSIIVFLAVLACLAADGIWFWFGRRWGSQAMWLLCRLTADPRKSSKNAHEKFRRYGLLLLCVAKFVPGLNGVMPPLVAAEGVSLARFLALDTLGASSGQASMQG